MKSAIPLLIALTLLPCAVHAQKSNPFQSIGKTAKVHTLSNGRYQETFDDDVLQRVGTVVINRRTKKVVKLLNADSLSNEASDNSTASRWNGIDPLAEKYYSISPYAFVANNPIKYRDIDGRRIIGADNKPVYFDNKNGKVEWSQNTSIDVQRVGNAMLKTKTGREVFKAMQDAEYNITMELDYMSITPGKMAETAPAFGKDGKVESVAIKFFMGEIRDVANKAISKQGLDEQTSTMLKNNFSEEQVLGANGAHEGTHATDKQNLQDLYDNSYKGTNKDIEAGPEKVEQNFIDETIQQKNAGKQR